MDFFGFFVILWPFYLLLIARLIFLLARKEDVSENNSLKLKSQIFYFYALAFFFFSLTFVWILVGCLHSEPLAWLLPLFLSPVLFVSGLIFFLLFFIYKKVKKVSYFDYGAIISFSLLLFLHTLYLVLRLSGFLPW